MRSSLILFAFFALVASAIAVHSMPSASRKLMRTSCRALYDTKTQKYSGGLLSSFYVKSVNSDGVDGINNCCFNCSSKDGCMFWSYYQPCKNNATMSQGMCLGKCKLYSKKATKKNYNGCAPKDGDGPACYYTSAQKYQFPTAG